MAWTRYQLGLAALMLLTGSINTLAAKWADTFSAAGCGGTEDHGFNHPFLQAVGMFLGEFSCLGVFYLLVWRDRHRPEPSMAPSQPFNPLLFLPPALCDMTGTSIMYVALNMTSASSFQMLRGSVIIFTGLLSVAFLGRKLELSQWLGILVTIVGLVVVGLADLHGTHDQKRKLSEVITGDLLIIMAQVIVAIQMVLEEKFVYKHDVHPLRAVGTEGFFGFVILALLLVPMYYIPAGSFSGNPRRTLEDALDAFCQLGHRPLIALALLGNISSIAFFNFAGVSVTKEISATTRMVLDSLRTVVIWAVSLAVGWETFHGLQILGFLVLLAGAALYNGLHRPLARRSAEGRGQGERGDGAGGGTVTPAGPAHRDVVAGAGTGGAAAAVHGALDGGAIRGCGGRRRRRQGARGVGGVTVPRLTSAPAAAHPGTPGGCKPPPAPGPPRRSRPGPGARGCCRICCGSARPARSSGCTRSRGSRRPSRRVLREAGNPQQPPPPLQQPGARCKHGGRCTCLHAAPTAPPTPGAGSRHSREQGSRMQGRSSGCGPGSAQGGPAPGRGAAVQKR
uniref:Solute carrier family 35 member F6 n=1 Tax=Apteryx owenii TaxID=8824 RepID=A0A8B9S4M1_APTOW